MFADYQSQVLLTCREKKAANTLSPNLIKSTPAKLRDECILVFQERYKHHEDEKTLRLFFGSQANEEAYMRTIQRFDTDKFRPLDNFLKGNISQTHDKNIELLAWLIDFKPRPYRWDFDYQYQHPRIQQASTPVASMINGAKLVEIPGEEPGKDRPARLMEQVKETGIRQPDAPSLIQGTHKPPAGTAGARLLRNARIPLLIAAITISGAYAILKPNPFGQNSCMYWTGDQYQAVPCSVHPGDKTLYAIDTARLTHFKKITTPDTITLKAIRNIWYSKIDNVVEFYTADGFHPVHVEKKLKPLTQRIWEKYVPHH